jgi:hypothetical protein
MSTIKLLARYRVDRADGATVSGPEQLVVLVLVPTEGHEFAVALSPVDAMMLSLQLSNVAGDARGGH